MKKFNWAPKLSDFNIGEKINKISVFEIDKNSKFLLKLILLNPFSKIDVADLKWTAILSESDKGKIAIRKKGKSNNINL